MCTATVQKSTPTKMAAVTNEVIAAKISEVCPLLYVASMRLENEQTRCQNELRPVGFDVDGDVVDAREFGADGVFDPV
jgi:hypothetical protein